MQFGDRVLYDNGSSNTLGVYLKEISSHEALVKLDDNPVKVVLPTDNLTFIKNMDNMDSCSSFSSCRLHCKRTI